ncbi:Uncharacterised protein [Mycobacteroides abscessus subsp. abscessus]|nr:Uncharacterised protein [Mycobacteroides abscessus subsp. abscessus]
MRHHPLRCDPHGTRRDLRGLRPPAPRPARRRAGSHLRAERHRRGRPAAGAGRSHRGGLAGAGRRADRAVPHGHARPERAAAGPLHRRDRSRGVDRAVGRDDAAAGHRLPRARRPRRARGPPAGRGRVLRRARRRGHRARSRPVVPRAGQRIHRGADAPAVRRARRGSAAPGQARPLRPPAVAGPPRRRAVLGRRRPGAGPPRLAHRVHRDRRPLPGHALHRAGRRLRPALPPPRDGRRARLRRDRAGDGPALRPHRDGGAGRGEDVQVPGQPGAGLHPAPARGGPAGHPPGHPRPPLPGGLVLDRRAAGALPRAPAHLAPGSAGGPRGRTDRPSGGRGRSRRVAGASAAAPGAGAARR